MLRYFLRAAAESSNLSTLSAIWGECNRLQWFSEREYYLTHGMYIRGLLRLGKLVDGMKEYSLYNRYHPVNNTINTLVLQGLEEGGATRIRSCSSLRCSPERALTGARRCS